MAEDSERISAIQESVATLRGKIEAIDKGTDALNDRQSKLDDRQSKLDERIRPLENFKALAFGAGVFFLAGGAFGAYVLSTLEKRQTTLTQSVDAAEKSAQTFTKQLEENQRQLALLARPDELLRNLTNKLKQEQQTLETNGRRTWDAYTKTLKHDIDTTAETGRKNIDDLIRDVNVIKFGTIIKLRSQNTTRCVDDNVTHAGNVLTAYGCNGLNTQDFEVLRKGQH
jgi:F0F1-type ATP synthase membrane subunit b/b'